LSEDTKPPDTPNEVSAEESKSVLYYCPLPGDPSETTVHDVKFKAYEATEIHPHREWLAEKLSTNPWFGREINAERKEKWDAK
jgi:hypothetical protein